MKESEQKEQNPERPGEAALTSEGHAEFDEILLEDTISRCAELLEAALEERRSFLVQGVLAKLCAVRREFSGTSSASAGKEWIDVESLSSLRTLVGGRFASLKKKWVDAGFPLRQHRGDKNHSYKIREEGWIELAAWIAKQGYEARLADPEENCPIKIRQTAGK